MGGSLPNIPGTAGSRQGRKARAVIGAGVLLAALTVASAVLLVWNDRAAQLALWQRNVGSIATTVAAHADQSLRTADLVLLGVQGMTHQERPQAAADVPGLFGTPEMQAALQAKVSGIPQLDMAMIIDASGHVVSSSRELPASRVDVSERDYFRAGMKLLGERVLHQRAVSRTDCWRLDVQPGAADYWPQWGAGRGGGCGDEQPILRRVL